MKITVTKESALSQPSDCVVVAYDSSGLLGETGKRLDEFLLGACGRAIQAGVLGNQVGGPTLIPLPADAPATSALLVEVEEPASVDQEKAWLLGGKTLRKLIDRHWGRVVVAIDDLVPSSAADAFVSGAIQATQGQDLYRATATTKAPDELVFATSEVDVAQRGVVIGESVNFTRHLVNQPPNLLYPESFVEQVSEMAGQVGLEVEVWDAARLQHERCEALLSVARASDRPPRLLILRYRGGGEEPPLALVGKGVTFDSGGLSLKPTDSMTDMKCDMAGAGTVVGVMRAIAKLGLKQNVTAYCGLVENMISGSAYKLGDVITSRAGKTIEILNTDAEGRVVLADVLDVACDDQPRGIVDLATLTGACMVALGMDVVGLFTNNDALAKEVESAAQTAGEPLWRMPMFRAYNEMISSNIADIRNTGGGRWAGAITAAKFLEQFVRDVPWVHLDIAGPAFAESSKSHRDGGATGVMVRTLVSMLADAK